VFTSQGVPNPTTGMELSIDLSAVSLLDASLLEYLGTYGWKLDVVLKAWERVGMLLNSFSLSSSPLLRFYCTAAWLTALSCSEGESAAEQEALEFIRAHSDASIGQSSSRDKTSFEDECSTLEGTIVISFIYSYILS
jgi:hypothetical protein